MVKIVFITLICFSGALAHVKYLSSADMDEVFQPVQGLYIKRSDDGTSGDLYVAASEDSGATTPWISEKSVTLAAPTKAKNVLTPSYQELQASALTELTLEALISALQQQLMKTSNTYNTAQVSNEKDIKYIVVDDKKKEENTVTSVPIVAQAPMSYPSYSAAYAYTYPQYYYVPAPTYTQAVPAQPVTVVEAKAEPPTTINPIVSANNGTN